MLKRSPSRFLMTALLVVCLGLSASPAAAVGLAQLPSTPGEPSASNVPVTDSSNIYLPLLTRAQPPASPQQPRVNVPFFEDAVSFQQMAVFWFGAVNSQTNYADVRVGYNSSELVVRMGIFDRFLWYDTGPDPAGMDQWDAVSLYLDLDGDQGLSADSYLFRGQLNWHESRTNYQAAFQALAGQWIPAPIDFSTESFWRGNAPNNDDQNDRGWAIEFHIPFTSLGLSGPPDQASMWRMAVGMSDRDRNEAVNPLQFWPATMNATNPTTWGTLHFGLPGYQPPHASPGGMVTIRQGLDGQQVVDGTVGGSTTCGQGLDFWSEWGDFSEPGKADANIQNQYDIADWPCYSKYYITIPLDALPHGKAILSASLTLHQFGNSGGGEWGEPPASLLQVLTVASDWDEATLSWNNAPLPVENVSQAWVEGLTSFPGWPGVPHNWDVSRAVADAYARGEPLRLAVYSADGDYHSGKYFVTSDAEDWNKKARPTLTVEWGNP